MLAIRTFSNETLTLLSARGDNAALISGYRSVLNTSYMSAESVDSEAAVQIPDVIGSFETLLFFESRPEVAQRIYNDYQWSCNNNSECADIFYSARDFVYNIQGDAFAESDDWAEIVHRIGMNAYFKHHIMDPAFTRMRLTGSAKRWIIESITMRMGLLKNFGKLVKDPVSTGMERKASHLDMAGHIQPRPERVNVPEHTSSKDKEEAGKEPTKECFKEKSLSHKPAGEGLSSSTKSVNISQTVAGRTLFYKSGDIARLNKIFGDGIDLKVNELLSRPPCDFAFQPTRLGLYLSKQSAVAWEYAQWAKRFADGRVVPIGVLAIAIPQALTSNIYSVVGEEWAKLVWVSRRKEYRGPDRRSLNHLSQCDWLTGPQCRQNNDTVAGMQEKSQIVPWRLKSGESASQHVTSSEDMVEQLSTACVENVWITEIAHDQ